MTTIDWDTIERGTEIKVTGVSGHFAFHYFRNGEVTVWGGAKDPGGLRQFRTFTPDRCTTYHPRTESRRMRTSTVPTPTLRTRRNRKATR